MKILFLSKFFITLLILALFDKSLLFAETYQWTDANGSVHFSDSPPMNTPKNIKPILRRDEKYGRDRSRYRDHIQSRINDAFRKTIAYTIPTPKTIVRLFINMNGKLSRTKIERSSGDRVFDISVLRAINLASEKFSPPPDNKEFEEVFIFKHEKDNNETRDQDISQDRAFSKAPRPDQ